MKEESRREVQSVGELRARRRKKRIRRTAVFVVVLALLLAYITGIFSASIAAMGDAFESISIALMKGEGYPTNVPVSKLKKTVAVGSNSAYLGETDLVILSSSGAETLRMQHGYANPAISTSNTRICVYNRGGTELQVESMTRMLFKQTFEKPILLATMSENGYLAVATKSERFVAQVIVYNAGFEELYKVHAVHIPMLVTFGDNSNQLAIASYIAEGGALHTEIVLYNKGVEATKIYKENSLALQIHYLNSSTVRILYDNCVIVYNINSGEELGRYVYNSSTILCTDNTKGNNIAIVFGDEKQTALNKVVVVSDDMQEILQIPLGVAVEDVLITRDRLYILTGMQVLKYDLKGELLETIDLENYADQLIYSKKVLVVTSKEVIEIL